ncbi:hypothetical protein AB6A40_005921 [Gnathostoma spinigerum]|uniref:Tyrosine-protein kinase ephrin type A/B receptor-like domain-containing protein n=1 Tax=Gnathostoma spinigerum TaxID=75299 RepID=A0ABD6EJ24_9BILA
MLVHCLLASVALCKAGSYHNTKKRQCEDCPRGQFQPRSGRSFCGRCPDGFTTLAEGSTNSSSCVVECAPGEYLSLKTLKCRKCGPSAYQPKAGQTECIRCPNGSVTVANNSTSLNDCIGLLIFQLLVGKMPKKNMVINTVYMGIMSRPL